MAPSFKRGFEKHSSSGFSRAEVHEAGWQAQNIGIVMSTGQAAQLRSPAKRSPDTLVLIGGYTGPARRSAEDNAQLVGAPLSLRSL